MKSLKRFLPVLLLVSGCALLAVSVIMGDVTLFLFVVLPVFTGNGPLFVVSIILLLAGFFSLPLIFAGDEEFLLSPHSGSANLQNKERDKSRIRAGGVIFIGPIPILVAGDGRTAFYTMLLATIVISVLMLLLL